MRIITDTLSLSELKRMAEGMCGTMAKAVVDARRTVIAVDAELHADLEAALLDDGSQQADLWGINLYPDESEDQFIEFDSMINVRPSHGNRSRFVESEVVRDRFAEIVKTRIVT